MNCSSTGEMSSAKSLLEIYSPSSFSALLPMGGTIAIGTPLILDLGFGCAKQSGGLSGATCVDPVDVH